MQIKILQVIIDDNGTECRVGDTVLLKTKSMDEPAPAIIDKIMTNVSVYIIDDRVMGYRPIRVRKNDVDTLTLHKRYTPKKKPR